MAMRFRNTPTFLILAIVLVVALPAVAQQKPFTQEQVSKMVQAGLGDDSGSRLIEQRGIDFAPAEDFIQTLKAAGASEAFINALRAANPKCGYCWYSSPGEANYGNSELESSSPRNPH